MPTHPADVPSRGEINQTGDVIRTALLLGDAGFTEEYESAERYLRSMLLPTQHDEEELSWYLRNDPTAKEDSRRNVLFRCIGGYAMQLPNDRMRTGDWPITTLDITSGAVHALCECWRHRVTWKDTTARVNLLFDYEDERLTLKSDLPVRGCLRFSPRVPMELRIRIPPWVDRKTLRLFVGDVETEVRCEGGYLCMGELAVGQEGEVRFSVPVKEEKETVDGVEYTTRWMGSQIIRILPRGEVSPLPF